ncbi:hypothetical protein SSBG_01672 [Streptomyces sp. SPB074]|nr:hypothetical protein SSBG_01672 [Streptomyces sp. SPB074]
MTVDPAIAEAAAALDPDRIGPEEVALALGLAGIGDGVLPVRMAPVLAVLQALPPRLAARLLPEVIGRLYPGVEAPRGPRPRAVPGRGAAITPKG